MRLKRCKAGQHLVMAGVAWMAGENGWTAADFGAGSVRCMAAGVGAWLDVDSSWMELK